MIAMQLEDRAEQAKVKLRKLYAGHMGKISFALARWNSHINKIFIGMPSS
jgi:hypothetical protein